MLGIWKYAHAGNFWNKKGAVRLDLMAKYMLLNLKISHNFKVYNWILLAMRLHLKMAVTSSVYAILQLCAIKFYEAIACT